jgi:flagellar basal body L-ring protein FlgH
MKHILIAVCAALLVAGCGSKGATTQGKATIEQRALKDFKHETAAIHEFSYGVADRGASIRVPHSFVKNDYRGYLEDRRPNSQGDPYQIASQILKTIESVSIGKISAAA